MARYRTATPRDDYSATIAAIVDLTARLMQGITAALNSFMAKCASDATSSCAKADADKKLSGPAKDSFTTKCVKEATGT